MATFTLEQLREKHPNETAKRILSLDDIQQQAEISKITEGNVFEQEQPKGKLEKAKDFITGIIGGGKLAEGMGQAIASKKIIGGLSEEQRQTEELQNKILARIKEKKSLGEDTSRLEKTLKDSQLLAISLQDTQKDFEESLVSSKEVIGSSVRLASTLGAGLLSRSALKAVAFSGKGIGFVQGALRGAGAGAISGGITGGIQGAGLAAEADKSSQEILLSGLLGTAGGIVAGGALGAITGGVGGGIKQRTITKENFHKELVSPKLSKQDRIGAIFQGRLKDPTLLNKAEVQMTKHDEKIAESIKDVVRPKATIGENVDSIRLKVRELNDGVKNYIAINKIPFNTNQLRTQLETGKDDLRLIFASDKTAERTYNAVSEAFMNHVKSKDTAGLFDARQTFDKIPAIKKLLESDKLGENARKEIVLAVRRAANEYIANQLPKGNPYSATMKIETYMLEALGNLAEKSENIIGKNTLQIITEQYPILKWVIGGIAGGIATTIGIGLGRGIGAGGSIVGSSE